MYAAAAAKSLQSCPALCDLIDQSSPGPSVYGILQARILEWVVISFSTASSPTPGFEPVSLAYPALTGRFFTPSAT